MKNSNSVNSNKRKVSIWELYLTREIAIEFKACLYFFSILFFYCVYRIIYGSWSADIIHLIEMIFTCYIIGYIQVYLLKNFDEAEHLGLIEIAGMFICTFLYCLISYLGSWYGRNMIATLIFAAYILLVYFCVFYIYKSKRHIDDKILNEELKLFQTEHIRNNKDKK